LTQQQQPWQRQTHHTSDVRLADRYQLTIISRNDRPTASLSLAVAISRPRATRHWNHARATTSQPIKRSPMCALHIHNARGNDHSLRAAHNDAAWIKQPRLPKSCLLE